MDYGFKGNFRYGNDKSDYNVVDTRTNTILCPDCNDNGSIVAKLERKVEEETPFSEKIAPLVSDIRVMTMTLQNLILDSVRFEELEDGRLQMTDEEGNQQIFKNDEAFMNWLLEESLNY